MKRIVSIIIFSLFYTGHICAQKTTTSIGVHINKYRVAEGLEFGRNFSDKFSLSIFQIVETETNNERTIFKTVYIGILPNFRLIRYKNFEWRAGVYTGVANKYFITVIPETSIKYHFNDNLSFSLSGYFRESILTLSPKLCLSF